MAPRSPLPRMLSTRLKPAVSSIVVAKRSTLAWKVDSRKGGWGQEKCKGARLEMEACGSGGARHGCDLPWLLPATSGLSGLEKRAYRKLKATRSTSCPHLFGPQQALRHMEGAPAEHSG